MGQTGVLRQSLLTILTSNLGLIQEEVIKVGI